MTLCSISYAVNTLNNRVHCCVISYRTICSIKVIINCSRQTYATDIKLLSKLHRTCQRTITTNDHESINAMFDNIIIGFLLTLRSFELRRTRSFQHCAPLIDDATNVFCREINDFAINKTIIPTIDCLNIETIINACTCNRTYCSIHTRCISARS